MELVSKHLIEHSRNGSKAHTILASHFIWNEKSHRMMEKCGLPPARPDIATPQDLTAPEKSKS